MPTIGPDLELQGAIVTLLSADSELQGYLGNPARIYQEVPSDAEKPYVAIGESDVLDDSVQCLAGVEVFPELHVWTDEPGFETAKKIGAIIRNLLHDASLSLTENRCASILHRRTANLRDQNYPVKHIIVTFAARLENAA